MYAFTFALHIDMYTADGRWVYRFKIDVKPASDGLHWDYSQDAKVSIVSVVLCRRSGM
jgi:hypothetical protein